MDIPACWGYSEFEGLELALAFSVLALDGQLPLWSSEIPALTL